MFYNAGLRITKVQNSREDGWLNMAQWLHPVPDGTGGKKPRLQIFENCHELIRCIPAIQHDEKNPNDCAKEPHDITHMNDALRYLLDGRPSPAAIPATPDYDEPKTYDEQIDDFFDYGG